MNTHILKRGSFFSIRVKCFHENNEYEWVHMFTPTVIWSLMFSASFLNSSSSPMTLALRNCPRSRRRDRQLMQNAGAERTKGKEGDKGKGENNIMFVKSWNCVMWCDAIILLTNKVLCFYSLPAPRKLHCPTCIFLKAFGTWAPGSVSLSHCCFAIQTLTLNYFANIHIQRQRYPQVMGRCVWLLTHTHTQTLIHSHTHTHTQTQTLMHTHTHTQTHTQTQERMQACAHNHTFSVSALMNNYNI